MLERIRTRSGWVGVAISIAGVAAFTLILIPFRASLNSTEVALGLLMVVLAASTFFGSRAGLAASVFCILSFNFFFLPPYYTFNIAGTENWVAFGAFLITALVSGQLSGYALRQAHESEQRRLEIERLYKELSEAFEQASEAEALRRSEKLKSSLLDAVTHDLRTPLTSIKAAVTTMLTPSNEFQINDPSAIDLLKIVDEETDRLNYSVEKLVGIAKVEAGAIERLSHPTSVEEIVSNVVGRASKLLAEREITIDVTSDLPNVFVDPIAISEALYTVLDNAAKYSKPPGKIKLTARPTGEGSVMLSVQDQGIGIAKELRERVFEKFYRAGNGGGRFFPGLGLGLAFARGLVESQGGKIFLADPESEYSTNFVLTLPTEV